MQERRRVPPHPPGRRHRSVRKSLCSRPSRRRKQRCLPGSRSPRAGRCALAALGARPDASHRAARGGRRPVPCVKAAHAGHSCPSGNGRGLPWTLQAAVWVISGTRRRPLPVGRGRSPRAGCARPLLGSCHCGRTCGDQLQMRTCPRGPLPEIEATKSQGAEGTLEKAL